MTPKLKTEYDLHICFGKIFKENDPQVDILFFIDMKVRKPLKNGIFVNI